MLTVRRRGARDEPEPGANTIAWLVWHLARVQDDHVAHAFGVEQVWTDGGWARFGLALPVTDIGYGHSEADVSAVRAEAGLLLGYLEAVHARLVELLASVDVALWTSVRHAMGPAGDPRGPAGQRAARRPPARRSGRLSAGLLESSAA